MNTTTEVGATMEDTSWKLPSRRKVGILSFILAESAIFAIFIVAYIFYVGKSTDGPTPRRLLVVPILTTICLLSSSLTVQFAVAAFRKGRRSVFLGLWLTTLTLGTIFLTGTAREWHRLIRKENFTIQTNLFGTTYYSTVGLHAFHLTVGIIALVLVLMLALFGKVEREHGEQLEVLSIYWHFVDAVWVVVFTVVYIVGR
jgi:cytochrome c oxidase subunit III